MVSETGIGASTRSLAQRVAGRLRLARGSQAKSLRAQTVHGALWTLGGFGLKRVIGLGGSLLLAWLLAPEAFGIMAIVYAVMQGLDMFSDLGIKASIIQSKKGHDPAFLRTAWTIQVCRGVALWLCTCILAWPLAAWFARSDVAAWQLMYLLPVAGFTAAIRGFNSTRLATLNREMRLGPITIIELLSQILTLITMIAWAAVHASVWALVAGVFVSRVAELAVSHFLATDHRDRFGWDAACAHELMKFGKWIFLTTILTFLALEADKLVLGSVLSIAALGVYSIAFRFIKTTLVVVMRLGDTVLFPVYAKLRDNPTRMVGAAIRAREVVLWVSTAMCASLAIAAPLFFETVLDPRYHDAGRLTRWMAIYVWAASLLLTMERIPIALGNSRAGFVSNLFRCSGMLTAILGYWIAELPGFIVGLSAGSLIAHAYLFLHVPSRRWAMFNQSVRFSAGGFAYSIPAILLLDWAEGISGFWLYFVLVGLFATIPVLVAAWMAVKLIRMK